MNVTLEGPPILFVDLDGTVRHGYDELGRFVNHVSDVVVFPEAVDRIHAWREAGGIAVGVTNQAGMALGHLDPTEHIDICRVTQQRAGLDKVLACVHHPDAGCWCRKPSAGLLWQAVAWVNATRLLLPPRERCLMVGDRLEDQGAAETAGVPFLKASAWRAGAPHPGSDS